VLQAQATKNVNKGHMLVGMVSAARVAHQQPLYGQPSRLSPESYIWAKALCAVFPKPRGWCLLHGGIECQDAVHRGAFQRKCDKAAIIGASIARMTSEPHLRLAIGRAIHRRLEIFLPVLIIKSLLVLVAQHLVCLGQFLESGPTTPA